MSDDSSIWMRTTIRMIAVAAVIAGGINWFAVAFGYNLVESLSRLFKDGFKNRFPLDKIIYFIVGVSAIVLAFDRTLWLPFLGESVLPSALIPVTNAGASTGANTKTVKVQVTPNTKVAYWAAKPGDNPDTPVVDAYGKYDNSGVVMSDASGIATLVFEKGTEYTVPSGKHLKSHVHYRELTGAYGMIGPVKTVFI